MRCVLSRRVVRRASPCVVQRELSGNVPVSADPGQVARLLLLAREHAVEPCVAACLQLLLDKVWRMSSCGIHAHIGCAGTLQPASSMPTTSNLFCMHYKAQWPHSPAQAADLPATTCLLLLSTLDTGASEHSALQAAADRLLAACCERTGELLEADSATSANADVQAQLLRFLGPLQHMLNDQRRRELYRGLPFEMLRVRARLPHSAS